jgi:hypothetical protein
MHGERLSLSRDVGTVESTTGGGKDEETSPLSITIIIFISTLGTERKNPIDL